MSEDNEIIPERAEELKPMNIEESKEFLKNEYIRIGFELMEEQESEIILRLRDVDWVLTSEDIKEYCDFVNNQKNGFQISPNECSIISPNYRENVVVPVDVYRTPRAHSFLDEGEATFGEFSAEKIHVKIGLASDLFLNYFRFDEDLFYSSRRVFVRRREGEILYLRDLIRGPLTIKIFNMAEKDLEGAVRRSTKIFEDCLFQLAYLKDISLWISEEWPHKRRFRRNIFTFTEDYRGYEFPLNTSFNSDLIRFYQFAMSSNIPEQKFLAFYHVLEFLFISASNEKLYEKLGNILRDPRFTPSDGNLARLVHDINSDRRETDETTMLKNVLEKYVLPTELIIFLKDYEKHIGEKIYSKQHDVFGDNLRVELKENHVISNISIHVKKVRDALVHSADSYEHRSRHVPFTHTTKLIEQDIPLLKYLAERVIISSSTSRAR